MEPITWIVIAVAVGAPNAYFSGHMAGVSQQHRADHQALVRDCGLMGQSASRLTKTKVSARLVYGDSPQCQLGLKKGVRLTEKQKQILRTLKNPKFAVVK